MKRRLLALAGACILSLQAPGGAAVVPGVRSSGTLVVRADVSGTPLDVGGNVALYRRGAQYRLDVLNLGFPGQDKTLSAIAAATLLAPGGVTFLYDGATGGLVAYSNANKTIYQETPAPHPATNNAPAATAPPPVNDPLAALAAVSHALRDVKTASINILGHPNVNGHPATDLDVSLQRQPAGRSLESYRARIALADDLDGFPLKVAFTSTPQNKSQVGGSLQLDLSTVQQADNADAVFAVPTGYTRVSSLTDILRAHR